MKATEFLLEIIEKQSEFIALKDQQIELLEKEVKRLKKLKMIY